MSKTVMPNEDELDKQFRELVIGASKKILQDSGSLSPHVLAYSNDALTYISLPPNKELWRAVATLGIIKSGAGAYAFVSESWVAVLDKTASLDEKRMMLRGVVMPSQHPDRKEALFVIFYYRDKPPKAVNIMFKRGSGKEIIFERESWMDADSIVDNRVGNVFEILDEMAKDVRQRLRNKEFGMGG